MINSLKITSAGKTWQLPPSELDLCRVCLPVTLPGCRRACRSRDAHCPPRLAPARMRVTTRDWEDARLYFAAAARVLSWPGAGTGRQVVRDVPGLDYKVLFVLWLPTLLLTQGNGLCGCQAARGKRGELRHRKPEPDAPRASMSRRTLPGEGGQRGPSALLALIQHWDMKGTAERSPPHLPQVPRDNSAGHRKEVTLQCSPIPTRMPWDSEHLSLQKVGFSVGWDRLNPLGCWFCMGDLQALATYIHSPGKATEQ